MKIAVATLTRSALGLGGQAAPGRVDLCAHLVDELAGGLSGARADLAVLLASAHFEDELAGLAERLFERLAPRAMIGSTAEAIISGQYEYEGQPALVLWAASLPGAQVISFHLVQENLEQIETQQDLIERLGVPPEARPGFILLGDPFSFNALELLERLNEAYPGRPVIGGLASAGERPGQNVILFDGQALRSGLAGVALWGSVHMDAVVSQGCRPIGRPWVITRAERNVIYQLGGQAPLAVVMRLLEEIPPADRELARQRGLLIGRVINEQQPSFGRGDFLIRNPLGFDSRSGAMAVGDLVRPGQTVQFQVRDARSAAEDLDELLERAARARPVGALIFTCNGRGTRLFSDRHHDARAVADRCGPLPAAGMFCAGEIGPVLGRNYLHGHTASIGLFRPGQAAGEPPGGGPGTDPAATGGD